MIPHTDALERILAPLAPLQTELVPLPDALGRVAAHDLAARLKNPPADVSAMDGYAVIGGEAPSGLRMIGESRAGAPFSGAVTPGTCIRIFTGSLLPEGADAILIQENATADGDIITPNASVKAGQFVRRAGQDFDLGDTVLRAGARIGARDIGLLAASGHVWVEVHRRPRVALLTTGDELGLPGDPLPPGGIVNSNGPMLAALVRTAGAEPVLLPPCPDDIDATARMLRSLAHVDLIVSVGGASVGDHDHMQAALGRAGFESDFWKIAMRPGKPLMHARREGQACIGLPGNPVAALVCGIVFLMPAIARLAGANTLAVPQETARLGAALPANDLRFDHLRATLSTNADGALIATPFARQDSGMIRVMTSADALILREAHAPAAEIGAPCRIIRFASIGL